jgi:succinylglutamate desuccinylase
VAEAIGQNYFERLDALRDGMADFVDRSHAARTQRTQHFVVANPIARPEDHLAARSHPPIMSSFAVQGKTEIMNSDF